MSVVAVPYSTFNNNDMRVRFILSKEMVEPPAHVGANHIYSNAYRKAAAAGLNKENCQKRARKATKIFRQLGKVRKHHVGAFHKKPRGSATTASRFDD